MTDLINTQLGQYRLIELIGHGGMATVYKAHQASLDRFVAIKVLPRTHDQLFAARFKREARAIAQLQHHNILPIHDYGEQDGLLYLVLPYIPNGVTLSDLLGKPMEPTRALRLTGHILDGLDYAHSHNVIHRDIKPSNILMSSPTWPMLADFGIAKLLNDDQRLTISGLILGTVAYMAPEQAVGRPVDRRADLYATGVMLYEMTTGRLPFEADTPLAMMMKHAYEAPPPPRALNPDLPAAVESILLRALQKDPAGRYQSAAEMAAALERATAQIERTRTWNQTTQLYDTGIRAFDEGRWNEAVSSLSQLVAIDSTFEDAVEFLAAARAAQEQRQTIPVPSEEAPRLVEPGSDDQQIRSVSLPQPSAADTSRLTHSATVPPSRTAATASSPVQTALQSIRPGVWFAIGGITVLLVLIGALASNITGGQGKEQPTSLPLSTGPNVSPEQAATNAQESTVITVAATQPLDSSPTTVAAATTPSLATSVASTEIEPSEAATTTVATPTPAPDAVVNQPQLNLRAGPSQAYTIVDVYVQGTALKVIGKEKSGEWLQVQTPDGKVGWMSATRLQVNIALVNVPLVTVPTLRPKPTPKPTAVPEPTTPAPQVDTPTPTDFVAPVDTPVPAITPISTDTSTPTKRREQPTPTRKPTPTLKD